MTAKRHDISSGMACFVAGALFEGLLTWELSHLA